MSTPKIEIIPLERFRPQTVNANGHTARGHAALGDSIQADGWIGALTVAADAETFDGSDRLEVAAEAGFDEAIVLETDGSRPVIIKRTDIPSAADPRAQRLGIAANRVAQLNLAWKPMVLAEMQAAGIPLAQWWHPEELAAALAQAGELPPPGNGGDAFGGTPDPAQTRVQAGDLWAIGPHRLAVGDSTDPAVLARLMGNVYADCVFTSPPYNSASELHGDGHFRGSLYLDKRVDAMTPEEYREFNRSVFFVLGLHVAPDGNVLYNLSYNKNNRDGYIRAIADALDAGWHVPETIIWSKRGMPNHAALDVLTRDYEFIFLLTRADTYRTTKRQGEVRSNLWEVSNTGAQLAQHRACFPVGLPERALQEFTEPGQVVLDPFIGSGTTLIAAHRAGRICYGVELLPEYANTVLARAEAEGIGPIVRLIPGLDNAGQ